MNFVDYSPLLEWVTLKYFLGGGGAQGNNENLELV